MSQPQKREFLEAGAKASPFVLPGQKPVMGKVAPPDVLARAREFLAAAESAPPPACLEGGDGPDEEEQHLTLQLGLGDAGVVEALSGGGDSRE